MKRRTHLLLGAAVALPIAVPLSPGLALGCLWFGAVGGGFPDWLDLRSEVGRTARMRHRGASHGILVVGLLAAAFWYAMRTLVGVAFDTSIGTISVPESAVVPWTLAFAAGMISHLASDAMTHAGIRPLLPLSSWRLRLLPRFLRSRYDGYLDVMLRWLSLAALGAGIALFMLRAW